MQPMPDPKPQLESTPDPPITACDVVRPSILLLEMKESIKVLLTRNTLIEPGIIHLRGVRLIEIPLGPRLAFIRFMSHFRKMYFPDEFEFPSLQLHTSLNPAQLRDGRSLIAKVPDPSRLIELTGTDCFALFNMNGRTLHRWVIDHFGLTGKASKTHLKNDRRAA
jgi:hypothetical protein